MAQRGILPPAHGRAATIAAATPVDRTFHHTRPLRKHRLLVSCVRGISQTPRSPRPRLQQVFLVFQTAPDDWRVSIGVPIAIRSGWAAALIAGRTLSKHTGPDPPVANPRWITHNLVACIAGATYDYCRRRRREAIQPSHHPMRPKWSLMQVVEAAIVFGQTEICDVGYGLTRIDRACA
jgi:hypothetical protein